MRRLGDKGDRGGEVATVAALLVAYWLAFQLVFFTYNFFSEGHVVGPVRLLVHFAQFFVRPIELMVVLAGALLCILLYLGVRWLRDRPFWLQLPAALATTIVTAILFGLIVRLGLRLYGVPTPPPTAVNLTIETMRWIAAMGVWTAVALAMVYNRQVREREARLAEVSAQAHEAQVRALRYQINPHFLYNTLNSIAALILDRRNDDAENMVMCLSDFFRASLAIDPFDDVPLARELALQRLYLDIETVRFDNLEVAIDVPQALERALVPSLILQPLIENALKHGVNDAPAPTLLAISAREAEGRLELEVRDNGPGISNTSGTGTGLGNVGRRLQARFGDAARLDVHSTPGSGFVVKLTLPLAFGRPDGAPFVLS